MVSGIQAYGNPAHTIVAGYQHRLCRLIAGPMLWADIISNSDPATKNAVIMARKYRDIEKSYSVKQTVAKPRRLADCMEQGKPDRIQIADEKISVPSNAVFGIDHEREGNSEEVEFQFKWERK